MRNATKGIARILITLMVFSLAGIYACSTTDDNNSNSSSIGILAYGGLDLILGVDEAAPSARISLLSEPVTAANGVTITEAAAVMEDLRLIMTAGNEVRWQHQNQEHWSRGMDDDDDDNDDLDDDDDDNDDNDEVGEVERGNEDSSSSSTMMSGDAEIDEENERADLDGPFYFDLIEGVSVPTIESSLLPAGVYNTIIFRLGDSAEVEGLADYGVDTTGPIAGNSIVLAGTLETDTETLDFIAVFADDDNSSYKIELNEELTIEADTVNTLIMNFDVASWADVLDLPGLYNDGLYTTDASGVIVFTIEDTDLRNTFRHRFCNSLRAGLDHDGDRKMGEDEAIDLLAEPEDEAAAEE